MQNLVIPSLIAKSKKEFNYRLNKITKHAKLLHLDYMDGKFVRNKSLNFKFKLPKSNKYEAHLMIKNPEKWIKSNIKKVDNIIIHVEATKNIDKIIKNIKKKRKKVGIALNPNTKVEKIKNYINKVDKILIMSVIPGKYGAKFLPNTLKKIRKLRKIKPRLNIQVDGSINPKTIKKVKNAGANMFVSGSYIQENKNPKKAIETLKKMIK